MASVSRNALMAFGVTHQTNVSHVPQSTDAKAVRALALRTAFHVQPLPPSCSTALALLPARLYTLLQATGFVFHVILHAEAVIPQAMDAAVLAVTRA